MRTQLTAAALAFAAAAPSSAALEPPPDCPRPIAPWTGGSDRVVAGLSGEGATADTYLAVLPPGYHSRPRRRYPVLYLLHGSESYAEEYLRCIRLLELSERDDVIVILPQGTPNGFWIDWHNGEQLREAALIEMVRAVDARFRSRPRAEHRAIGGLSMGGYGALTLAARRPTLFAAAASISGALGSADSSVERGPLVFALESTLAPGAFADPATAQGRAWRAAHDPIGLVESLRGLWIFVSSGTGTPCDADEARRVAELDPSAVAFEPLFREDHERMDAALSTANVEHESRRYDCGAHTFVTFQRGLAEAWPGLMRAVGARRGA